MPNCHWQYTVTAEEAGEDMSKAAEILRETLGGLQKRAEQAEEAASNSTQGAMQFMVALMDRNRQDVQRAEAEREERRRQRDQWDARLRREEQEQRSRMEERREKMRREDEERRRREDEARMARVEEDARRREAQLRESYEHRIEVERSNFSELLRQQEQRAQERMEMQERNFKLELKRTESKIEAKYGLGRLDLPKSIKNEYFLRLLDREIPDRSPLWEVANKAFALLQERGLGELLGGLGLNVPSPMAGSNGHAPAPELEADEVPMVFDSDLV